MTTIDAIEEAITNDEPLEVASFYAAANVDAQRALWLLSVSLVTPLTDLAANAKLVWPDMVDAETAVRAILDWPFVQEEAAGWRVSDTVASSFAVSFQKHEPEAFIRAHQLLAELEQAQEEQADADEGWFIRGRIAYYLAGYDADRSAREFNTNFAEPPTFGRVAARVWLTSLALHQAPLLGEEHARQLRFYRGFRAYVTGRFDEARNDLEAVLATGGGDMIAATAKHLVGVLTKRTNLNRSITLFEESIALCRRLGLIKGEIMAANSLAWAHVEKARLTPRVTEAELAEAARVAKKNADLAARDGDEGLALWCDYGDAAIEWLNLTENRRHVNAEAETRLDDIVGRLRQVRDRALDFGDIDTAIRAANDAAQAYADGERFDSALYELDAILDALDWVSSVPPVFAKLGQTAGSVRGQVGSRPIRNHADRVLDRVGNQVARSRHPEFLWSSDEDLLVT